jgi:hypothetical protein
MVMEDLFDSGTKEQGKSNSLVCSIGWLMAISAMTPPPMFASRLPLTLFLFPLLFVAQRCCGFNVANRLVDQSTLKIEP